MCHEWVLRKSHERAARMSCEWIVSHNSSESFVCEWFMCLAARMRLHVTNESDIGEDSSGTWGTYMVHTNRSYEWFVGLTSRIVTSRMSREFVTWVWRDLWASRTSDRTSDLWASRHEWRVSGVKTHFWFFCDVKTHSWRRSYEWFMGLTSRMSLHVTKESEMSLYATNESDSRHELTTHSWRDNSRQHSSETTPTSRMSLLSITNSMLLFSKTRAQLLYTQPIPQCSMLLFSKSKYH